MNNHNVVSAALQKYYSALKSLHEFGTKNDFFQDISLLDTFFSESRSITFAIQSYLNEDEKKIYYEPLCDHFLKTETLKWFLKVRNRSVHQTPFPLTKEIKLTLYSDNHEAIEIQDDRLKIKIEDSFQDIFDVIKTIINEKTDSKEIFFSSKILFYEGKKLIDIYPKIIDGILQMNTFLENFRKEINCNCQVCKMLDEKIEILLKNLQLSEIKFTKDYMLDDEFHEGSTSEFFVYSKEEKLIKLSEKRVLLETNYFDGCQGNIKKIFNKFLQMHITIYNHQNKNIMPVFMLVYNDDTFRLIPFLATTKATFYRKVNEIVNSVDFDEIISIFYCGEYYSYCLNEFEKINELNYDERTKTASQELLTFIMLDNEGLETSVSLDKNRTNDAKYVLRKMKVLDVNSFEKPTHKWLKPICDKLLTGYTQSDSLFISDKPNN